MQKEKTFKNIVEGSTLVLLLASLQAGCSAVPAGHVVAPGERVGVHFTCRQESGEIAVSTYDEVNNSSLPKSPLFTKRHRGDAVVINAGAYQPVTSAPGRRSFEDEILAQLAPTVVGMRVGEEAHLSIHADNLSALTADERSVKIARVWKQAKEMRLSVDRYRAMARREPAVGQVYTVYNAVPGKVVSVSGEEVLLRFAPTAAEVELPFGKGVISDKGDHYEIRVESSKGKLVRTGGMAGRVSEVADDYIALDYSNPLGGETLKCDLKVDNLALPLPSRFAPVSREAAPVPEAQPVEQKDPGEAAKAATAPRATGEATAAPAEATPLQDAAATKEASAAQGAADPLAASGDVGTVNFTASLADGSLVASTVESVANDPARKKSVAYRAVGTNGAAEVGVGKGELFPGLGAALVGMKEGEKKTVHLAPEQAFGPLDPSKETRLPLERTFPKRIRLTAAEYANRFAGFPAVGKEVDLVPYFKARVTQVTDQDVALEFQAENGKTVQESYGTVAISVAGDQVTTKLSPKMGASFPLEKGEGVISASDGTTFTVGGNSPLAGKELVLEVELVSLAKADPHAPAIDWVEDYAAARALSQKEGKPEVLVLYADWCGWCKKTFKEVLPDQRVSRLKEKFVWARVNSDKETKYKEMYAQDGFPLLLVLNPDGSVKKRLDGFRDARTLQAELAAQL